MENGAGSITASGSRRRGEMVRDLRNVTVSAAKHSQLVKKDMPDAFTA